MAERGTSGSCQSQFVILRLLVHAQNGDDVLERLVMLVLQEREGGEESVRGEGGIWSRSTGGGAGGPAYFQLPLIQRRTTIMLAK